MGVITFNASGRSNSRPSQSGWLSLNMSYNSTHIFTVQNFTTETIPQYVDPEGDPLNSIKIKSLPTVGVLSNNSIAVNIEDEILATDIANGLFKYISQSSEVNGYSDSSMTFTVSDTGSFLFTSSPNQVVFNVEYDTTTQNQPPNSVGNGELDIVVGEEKIITKSMLTTDLNPPYSDPEGDDADMLKVITVPLSGVLKLNGVLVVDGQEISFTDIDSGLFTYKSEGFPSGEIEKFEFEISDSASGKYSG